MPKEKIEGFMSIRSVINDSANQLMAFKFFDDITEIRKYIAEAKLKTLEEYTNKKKIELEKIKPGVCEKYNDLVNQLKNPDLTYENFQKITKEAWQVTRVV